MMIKSKDWQKMEQSARRQEQVVRGVYWAVDGKGLMKTIVMMKMIKMVMFDNDDNDDYSDDDDNDGDD